MVQNFKDEDSDSATEDEESEEEEEEKKEMNAEQVKDTLKQKIAKVNRRDSLKPFIDLEQYTLALNEMQSEFRHKLQDIQTGASDDSTIETLKKYKLPTRFTMNDNEFIPADGPPSEPLKHRSDIKNI